MFYDFFYQTVTLITLRRCMIYVINFIRLDLKLKLHIFVTLLISFSSFDIVYAHFSCTLYLV